MSAVPQEILNMPLPDGFEWAFVDSTYVGIVRDGLWHWWCYLSPDLADQYGTVWAQYPNEPAVPLATFKNDIVAAANYMSIKAMLGQYE